MEARPMDEILPFLFVGSECAAEDPAMLVSHHVSYVLTVSDRLPAAASRYPPHFAVYHVPLSDFGETPLEHVTDNCFAFINAAREADARVLVHCQVGVNRSPSIVIAYLMTHLSCDLLRGCREVKERRPIIYPVEGYLRQLLELELRLFRRNSCTLPDLEQVLQGGCVNRFHFPAFQNYQQHGFGGESEANSDDEQPDFGSEPLGAMPAQLPFALRGGAATSSAPGPLPLLSGLGDLQFHCRFLPALALGDEDLRRGPSSTPDSPQQPSPFGLGVPASPYRSPLHSTAHLGPFRPGVAQPLSGRRSLLLRSAEQSPILSPVQLSPPPYASLFPPTASKPTRSTSLSESPRPQPRRPYPAPSVASRHSYSCSPPPLSPTSTPRPLPPQTSPRPLPIAAGDCGGAALLLLESADRVGTRAVRRSPSPAGDVIAVTGNGGPADPEAELPLAPALPRPPACPGTAADGPPWLGCR
eukprot:EG_transcript_11473